MPKNVAVRHPQPGGSATNPAASWSAQTVRDWPIEHALTARPRGSAPPAKLVTGQSLRTGPAERRRVELPDGSILYLNHDTAITLKSPRCVTLERGEVYLEVAPRYDGIKPDKGEPADDERFVVLTPDRELVALGTRFNVRTDRQDGFARTTIDPTYFNQEAWRMEGTFYFPLLQELVHGAWDNKYDWIRRQTEQALRRK